MSSNVKTFLFAGVLCLVAGFILTFASEGLKEYQVINQKVDKQKNVLKVLGLIEPGKKYQTSDYLALYENNVKQAWLTEGGELSFESGEDNKMLFLYIKKGGLEAYAIPISGYGLWSTLYGYFSVEGDGNTVKGITFYEHKETPGLGGECEAPWFQNNFVGKQITNLKGDFVSVSIYKGKVADGVEKSKQINYVDGMSGATVTANGIQSFLKSDLLRYEPLSKRLREGERVL